ncbi:DNA/RNA non-specific endonuclease [bacterium]|nr:DNA/RNA non-specific endonuclease [bacterium]
MKCRLLSKTLLFGLLLLLGSGTLFGQTVKTIKTDIFEVEYSEELEQPLKLTYTVGCPLGGASRSGLDFHKEDGYLTSDNEDYKDNPYDKGHLAPAAAFNCDRETIKKTFSYLNCALQHEGLNRGPWKELERFERNLAKIYPEVTVVIIVNFEETPERVPGGAAIPTSFIKEITFAERTIKFLFPNQDVSGQDWFNFSIAE